jgi:hypothetical protein
MTKIKLTEAKMSPLDKMVAVELGQRNQNWGACSEEKLRMYYKLCIDNNLNKAIVDCEAEIKKRNLFNWLRPRLGALKSYSTDFAQHLWDERNTCHRIIQEAIDYPYVGPPDSRPSEYLLKAYVLIKCMGHSTELKMTEIWIKNHMRDQGTYYDEIPTILFRLYNLPAAMNHVSDAIQKVNYS